MTHCQHDELNASVKEQRVGDNQDCGILPLDKGCEGRIDFAVGAGVEDIDLLSDSGRRRLRRALREGLEIDRVVFDALVALRAR
jgi:hypothetical protein